MIAIFDYGAGNLRSVENTLAAIGEPFEIVNNADGLNKADKIILPGVGHYGQLLRSLDDLGVRDMFRERIASGVPFLGICLGFQALFETSEESPEQGLAVYPAALCASPLRRAFLKWAGIRSISRVSRACSADSAMLLTCTSQIAITSQAT